MNNLDYLRFHAEWEAQEAVLLALPNSATDWDYILDRAVACYQGLISAILSHTDLKVILLVRSADEARQQLGNLANNGSLYLLEAPFNDTWTRDYGPLSVEKDGCLRLLDFGFNGWGLKFASDRDNMVNFRLDFSGITTNGAYRNNRDFTLEGGSVESDGRGTILTTSECLCSPNRNGGKSKTEINEILARRLGAQHLLWLDHGALIGDDTDSHIDTLARICPHDTIAYCGAGDVSDPQHAGLKAMAEQLREFRTAEGNPYNLVELPLPDPVYSADGDRLPATYCNYLVTPGHVFVPTYGSAMKDTLALQIIGSVYSDREVVGVDCVALVEQHGSLHCATMQLMPGTINFEVLEKLRK